MVIVITSPGIDTFGFGGGAFLGEDANVGIMSHEVGHGFTLSHSFSDDPAYQNATWSAMGEYDDQWDLMSYANVLSTLEPLAQVVQAQCPSPRSDGLVAAQ